jgi:hypothetical protein
LLANEHEADLGLCPGGLHVESEPIHEQLQLSRVSRGDNFAEIFLELRCGLLVLGDGTRLSPKTRKNG